MNLLMLIGLPENDHWFTNVKVTNTQMSKWKLKKRNHSYNRGEENVKSKAYKDFTANISAYHTL